MQTDQLTHTIIKAAYTVHNSLGGGFLENVYHNAMLIELRQMGLEVDSQYPIKVYYKDCLVGEYYADLFVERQVIVELKAVENLHPAHEVQLVNYLQGTGIDIGLLINFATSVEVKRKYRVYNKKED
ncbi:MAG: GxxExxY protein [Bacteroidales bacterium]|nr:GxxExxY protein [Bacteroidales bacterium]